MACGRPTSSRPSRRRSPGNKSFGQAFPKACGVQGQSPCVSAAQRQRMPGDQRLSGRAGPRISRHNALLYICGLLRAFEGQPYFPRGHLPKASLVPLRGPLCRIPRRKGARAPILIMPWPNEQQGRLRYGALAVRPVGSPLLPSRAAPGILKRSCRGRTIPAHAVSAAGGRALSRRICLRSRDSRAGPRRNALRRDAHGHGGCTAHRPDSPTCRRGRP